MISAAGSGQGEKFIFRGNAEPTTLLGFSIWKNPGLPKLWLNPARAALGREAGGRRRAPHPGEPGAGNGRAGQRLPGGHRATAQD